uniref:Uncharacterized protein n=1 Tax=Meloidogyne floridensis TaxID=298350 RepID=A0A915NVJ3_9BILA
MCCQQLHGRIPNNIAELFENNRDDYTALDNFLDEHCRGEYNYEEQENIHIDRIIKVGIFKVDKSQFSP